MVHATMNARPIKLFENGRDVASFFLVHFMAVLAAAFYDASGRLTLVWDKPARRLLQ